MNLTSILALKQIIIDETDANVSFSRSLSTRKLFFMTTLPSMKTIHIATKWNHQRLTSLFSIVVPPWGQPFCTTWRAHSLNKQKAIDIKEYGQTFSIQKTYYRERWMRTHNLNHPHQLQETHNHECSIYFWVKGRISGFSASLHHHNSYK